MSEYENLRTADIVAEALIDWNVNVIFGLPGDGINGFIEALRQRQNKIKFILVRHEESAAFMACAYAKYTKKTWSVRCYLRPRCNTPLKRLI
jgi:pyruvate dehydrogenase (quinone)